MPAGEMTDDRWDVAAALVADKHAEPEAFGELADAGISAGEAMVPEITAGEDLPEMITGDMLTGAHAAAPGSQP